LVPADRPGRKGNLTIGAMDDSAIGEYANAGNADIAVIVDN